MDNDSKLLTEAYKKVNPPVIPPVTGSLIQRRTVALNNLKEERDNLYDLLDKVLSSLPHKHPWLNPKLEQACYDALFALDDEVQR